MNLKNIFSQEKNGDMIRYEAARGVFVFTTFFFFISFFMVASGYYREKFFMFLSPLYILMIVALNVFVFFLLKDKLSIQKKLSYPIFGGIIFCSLGFLSIVII